jgi:hypothetical protein
MLGLTRMLNDAGTLSAFAEIAVAVLGARPDTWTMDGGVAWVARRNLQWDVSAGHTFDNRGDWFVSAGITVRVR